MEPIESQIPAEQEQSMAAGEPACNHRPCPLADIATDIIDRLARIEENQITVRKQIEGNGKPGILERVDNLESRADEAKGSSRVKTWIASVVVTVFLAMFSGGLTLWVNFHKDELNLMQGLHETDTRLENKIDGVSQELQQHEQHTKDLLAHKKASTINR